jgi:hypothetical protein
MRLPRRPHRSTLLAAPSSDLEEPPRTAPLLVRRLMVAGPSGTGPGGMTLPDVEFTDARHQRTPSSAIRLTKAGKRFEVWTTNIVDPDRAGPAARRRRLAVCPSSRLVSGVQVVADDPCAAIPYALQLWLRCTAVSVDVLHLVRPGNRMLTEAGNGGLPNKSMADGDLHRGPLS